MATLNSSMAKAGDNGCLVRVKEGDDDIFYSALKDVAAPGVVYPDDSCEVDIIKPDFEIPNTFYYRFTRAEGLKQFQIMCRYRKRYSMTNAAIAKLDTSGADVWTDWSDWVTEKGTKDDPGKEVATVNIEKAGSDVVTWAGMPLVHTYSEINEYDKVIYQFKVRSYNSAKSECGAWTPCELAVYYPPAITGYSCERTYAANNSFSVTLQTNYTREVYVELRTQINGRKGALFSGGRYAPDNIKIYFPSNFVKKNGNVLVAQFNNSYLSPAGEDRAKCYRWCGNSTPVDYYQGYFTYQVIPHTEPELPYPSILTDRSGQTLKVNVTSDKPLLTTYDAVQGSITWIDAVTKQQQVVTLDFTKENDTWSASFVYPPLDTVMTLWVAVITDDYALWNTRVTVPSNGLLCFDGDLGSVRLKYNQSISTGDTIAGETIECVGREFPISRYGGVLSREIKLEATMLNSDILGGDGWKSNVEPLSGQADWILRIPGGEKYRVMITSLDRNTESPTNNKLLSVSISCKVVGYE